MLHPGSDTPHFMGLLAEDGASDSMQRHSSNRNTTCVIVVLRSEQSDRAAPTNRLEARA